MAECCPGPSSENPDRSVICSTCGTAGKPVDSLTVKALLKPAALSRYEHFAYRFCPGPTCLVVYFADTGITFLTADVRERVWEKEPAGHRMVCYCFGENEADIAAEIDQTGQSLAAERVRAQIEVQR